MNVSEKIYIGIITLVGLWALLFTGVPTVPTLEQMMMLWMLVGLATVSQFFEDAEIANQRTYYPHNVFFLRRVASAAHLAGTALCDSTARSLRGAATSAPAV